MKFLKRLSASLSIISLSACTALPISTPFKVVENEDAEKNLNDKLLVAITHTQVRPGQQKQFMSFVKQVENTLKNQLGLYGYSLRKELLGDQAWTMTVWYDESSMNSFKITYSHRSAMSSANSMLLNARFAKAWVDQSSLPIKWKNALKMLENTLRSYDY